MLYAIAATAVILTHFAFVLFVVLGGLLALRWTRAAWLHLPCAVWGAWIEFSGALCPLTPLENALRTAAGGAAYPQGFIEYYLLSLIYPAGLTRGLQWALGAVVIVINLGIYTLVLVRRRHRSTA